MKATLLWSYFSTILSSRHRQPNQLTLHFSVFQVHLRVSGLANLSITSNGKKSRRMLLITLEKALIKSKTPLRFPTLPRNKKFDLLISISTT